MNDPSLAAPTDGIEAIPALMRLRAVLQVTGLGRSTLYRMVAEHTFPSPVRLTERRAVAWRQEDVRHWTCGRPIASKAPDPTARRS